MTDEYPADGVFPMGSDDEFDRHPRTASKCYRHTWLTGCGACLHPTASHATRDYSCTCGCPSVQPPKVNVCANCGKVRDEAVVKRNRRNRQRGGAYERQVATALGGRRTGPLGGRDDVIVGELFAIQTKRAQRFALTEARKYLDDLRRTYPTRTPIVAHALPGERGGGVVILTFADWRWLHGDDGTEGAKP